MTLEDQEQKTEFTAQEVRATIEKLKGEKLRKINFLELELKALQNELKALDRVEERLLHAALKPASNCVSTVDEDLQSNRPPGQKEV